MINERDKTFMQLAILEAEKAFNLNETPVGAVAVLGDKVIGYGYNQRQQTNKISQHAEIIALEQAAQHVGAWQLHEVTLYVTVEPCMMCMGAILQSKVHKVVFGTKEEKSGSAISILNVKKIPHQPNLEIIGGVLEEKTTQLLKDFFKVHRETH